MAFPAEDYEWEKWTSFWVENPLSVNTDTLEDGCVDIRYKVKAKSPFTNEYVYFDDLLNELENSGFEDLEGENMYLYFWDGSSYETQGGYSSLSGSFSESAFASTNAAGETLRDLFTENGETAIYFKVYAIVPGSLTQGPKMANDNNPAVAAFKVVLIPDDVVQLCSDNQIFFNDALPDG
jgi:hypothetical protein